MRIGIDGFNLAIPRGTGVATYARSLSQAVAGLGHSVDVVYGLDIDPRADPALQETLFFDLLESERGRKTPPYPSVAWARQMLGAASGLDAGEIALTGRTIAAQLAPRLPHQDRILNVRDLFGLAARYFRNFGRFLTIRVKNPPAIMHWTYPVPVKLAGAANLYTIHDLVPLRLPYTTLDNKPNHVRLLNACFANAARIVTVSDTSRRDILDYFPKLSPNHVVNTYQAVPARTMDSDETARIVAAFGLQPHGYFLFFGSIEPKKNVGRLLEAFLASDIAATLVIVGARAWKSEQELALLKHRPPDDRRVRQIDYLPADMLGALIAGARAVVFPSLYEGFGLPVLEAMALGAPVLASTGGALPEVAGEAALLVDPYDPRAIAAGLRRLAAEDPDNDTLRAELTARGRVQAARFGMAQYQDRLAALYRSVLPNTA
jgi:glycosyltransferase involved in cell wall biosynthesis